MNKPVKKKIIIKSGGKTEKKKNKNRATPVLTSRCLAISGFTSRRKGSGQGLSGQDNKRDRIC